jgi:hypothetical protein
LEIRALQMPGLLHSLMIQATVPEALVSEQGIGYRAISAGAEVEHFLLEPTNCPLLHSDIAWSW